MPTYAQYVTSDSKNYITSDDKNFLVIAEEYLTINLYINTAEQSRVDKTGYLSSHGSIIGVFREATDIIHPVFMYNEVSLPTFNYVRIPTLGRYYYVRNIISTSYGLWAIELECDVLMSYKDNIYELDCLISRQQTASKCVDADTIPDELLTTDNSFSIAKYDFPNTPFSTSLDALTNNVVISVVGKGSNYYGDISSTGRNIHNPSTGFAKAGRYCNAYITSVTYLQYFLDKVWSTGIWSDLKAAYNEPLEQIISIKMYPFDLTAVNSEGKNRGVTRKSIGEKLNIGIVELDMGNDITGFYSMSPYYDSIFDFGTLRIETRSDRRFLDYSPYTDMVLYLPYIGTVSLNPIEVNNRTTSVEYAIDFATGACNAYIYTGTGSPVLIHNVEGLIGQDVPYSCVNRAAISREITRSVINAVTGTAQMATGAAAFAMLI